MRFLFRRSIFWLLPVIVLPLVALLVLQVRFLRTLEQKTASAERNVLRSAVDAVVWGIEDDYRNRANAALTLTADQINEVGALGKHFAKNAVPGARTHFVIRFRDTMWGIGYFDARGVEMIAPDAEIEAIKMATAPWHVAHRWNRVAHASLHVDERDRANRIIVRPVVDDSMHVVGLAGAILDEKAALAVMSATGKRILKDHGTGINFSLRIAQKFAHAPGAVSDYVTQPLAFVFNGWRAGVRDRCSTPEQIAAMNFRNNMMWTGGAFVVLLGAVGLAIGAVARQMRLSQMKSDFVSNVSHELRTPLSSIRVFGEYMRLGRVEKPEKIREYGEYIEAESRRLTQLINNILDFSRIESAEKKYHFCDSDLTELIEQTVAAFEVPLRDRGVRVALSTRRVPHINIDRDAIGQVLMNLLDNAVKYSNGDKRIEVAVEQNADEVRISVRDHGIGIAPAEQKKIFEKFYRVGTTLVHDVKGSGLGLSIVQHVVAAHGGRVEVASAPGEGSTFTIVLPLRRQDGVTVARTEYA